MPPQLAPRSTLPVTTASTHGPAGWSAAVLGLLAAGPVDRLRRSLPAPPAPHAALAPSGPPRLPPGEPDQRWHRGALPPAASCRPHASARRHWVHLVTSATCE